jgi:hypothetical protein
MWRGACHLKHANCSCFGPLPREERRAMAVTNKIHYMKKKIFTCGHCDREFDTMRGIRLHHTRMHPNAGPFETTITVEKPKRAITGKWYKTDKRSEQPNPDWKGVDTKGQITAVPDAQQRNSENVDAMRFMDTVGRSIPWYEKLLIDFEAACRGSEAMMNDDEWKSIKDVNPHLYAATVMKTFNDRRKRMLEVLEILDQKRIKYDAYERELLS